MVKKTKGAILIDNIRHTQEQFLNMSSEERIAFIKRYEQLMPYQTTALIQCKKFMTAAEKRVYREVVQKVAEKINEQNGPQPN